MKKCVFNWSGGKDSALALYKTLRSGEFEVVSLLTTIEKESGDSSMHRIPVELLKKQAGSLGIPLHLVELEREWKTEQYASAMSQVVADFKNRGVTHFVFGDIFLHDVRSYRQSQLHPLGIEVVEPLWDLTTAQVMEEFLQSGIKSVIVCTDVAVLGKEFLGRTIDRDLIGSLPESCDPCGENGEYHSFCYDGPMFAHPVKYSLLPARMSSSAIGLSDGTCQVYHYWHSPPR